MKYSYSPQKGKPGHCMLAQVWDEHGNVIANIASTKLQKDATQTAKLFSRSHEMKEALKVLAHLDDEICKCANCKIIKPILKELEP